MRRRMQAIRCVQSTRMGFSVQPVSASRNASSSGPAEKSAPTRLEADDVGADQLDGLAVVAVGGGMGEVEGQLGPHRHQGKKGNSIAYMPTIRRFPPRLNRRMGTRIFSYGARLYGIILVRQG